MHFHNNEPKVILHLLYHIIPLPRHVPSQPQDPNATLDCNANDVVSFFKESLDGIQTAQMIPAQTEISFYK